MAKRKLFHKQKETSSEPSRLKHFFKSDTTHFITGLIVLMFTVYALISVLSFFFTGAADQSKIEGFSFFYWGKVSGVQNWTGTRGAILSNILMNEWFGVSTIFLILFMAFVALRLMKAKYVNLLKQFILCSILTIWTSLALSFFLGGFFKDTAIYIGGKHGFLISDLMINNFGIPGTFLIILVIFVVIMTFISSQTIPFIRNLFKLKPREKKIKEEKKKKEKSIPEPENPEIEISPVIDNTPPKFVNTLDDDDFEIVIPGNDDESDVSIPQTDSKISPLPVDNGDEEDRNLLEELGVFDPTADLSHYNLPPVDLLQKYEPRDNQVDMAEQTDNKNKIIQTLEKFGIKIKSIKATVGPTVTLYEIVPEDGIRINKIRNLEDDIAMSLAALGIRIIAPMPGKGTIGIEVPNKDPQIVSMHSIIASRKFQESKFELPIALGRTITNEVFMVDLTKMPHLLVAGATGQGKSVGLNAAITSLLYKKHPAELKFVLIDPKMVEFSIYSIIEKYFLAKLPDTEKPIITDFTKVIYTLNSLTKEMDDRYVLLEKAGSRNVK
jgi:S-DNA-T family DNA segregation ATPase FtsK/SpoIIIE